MRDDLQAVWSAEMKPIRSVQVAEAPNIVTWFTVSIDFLGVTNSCEAKSNDLFSWSPLGVLLGVAGVVADEVLSG